MLCKGATHQLFWVMQKLENFSMIAKGDSGLTQQQQQMPSRLFHANSWQDLHGLAWTGVAGDLHGEEWQLIQEAGHPVALGNSIAWSLNAFLFHSPSLAFFFSPPLRFSFSSLHFPIPFCLALTKALILFLVLGLHTWETADHSTSCPSEKQPLPPKKTPKNFTPCFAENKAVVLKQ